jgi:hypothetical protein
MMAMTESHPEAMDIEMFPVVVEGVVDRPWKGDVAQGGKSEGMRGRFCDWEKCHIIMFRAQTEYCRIFKW